jgi:hypothetical protein
MLVANLEPGAGKTPADGDPNQPRRADAPERLQ